MLFDLPYRINERYIWSWSKNLYCIHFISIGILRKGLQFCFSPSLGKKGGLIWGRVHPVWCQSSAPTVESCRLPSRPRRQVSSAQDSTSTDALWLQLNRLALDSHSASVSLPCWDFQSQWMNPHGMITRPGYDNNFFSHLPYRASRWIFYLPEWQN